ncbi:hypothetical protein C1J02_14235 [Sulfitobacter sp. SK011]|nr:hypothetical protein C1J02_14235 [Sulfitobacter sp. SK011]
MVMKWRASFCSLSLALLALSACTQFPALDRTITPALENADYPALVPLDPLLASATAGRVDAVQTEAALNARVARLRARAARLRGSVLSGREKQRLEQGLQ